MKTISFVLFFVCTSVLYATDSPSLRDEDEVLLLEQLVETTRQNLEDQKKLLINLRHYKKAKQAFISDPNSRKLATSLVRASMLVKKDLDLGRFSYLFSQNFLTEVQFFAQIGEEILNTKEKT